MGISNQTLKAMVRDYQGIELSDEELELVRPEVDSYIEAMSSIEGLDLSIVMSGRLLHAEEGGISDAE